MDKNNDESCVLISLNTTGTYILLGPDLKCLFASLLESLNYSVSLHKSRMNLLGLQCNLS